MEEEKADGESFEILKGGYISTYICNKVTDESILNKFQIIQVTAVYSVEVPKIRELIIPYQSIHY